MRTISEGNGLPLQENRCYILVAREFLDIGCYIQFTYSMCTRRFLKQIVQHLCNF